VSACSATIWAVTSREIPKLPTIWPSSSRSGNFVVETQASGRSRKVSRSTFPTIDSPVRMIRCSSSKAAAACGSL